MSSSTAYGELNPVGGGDPIPLLKTHILIGRRSQCDVVLAFPNVSAQHCELELINGFWQARDLNSRNGIKVNGERCDTRWLQPGDELSVAKHVFRIEYQPTGDAPPPMEEEEDPLSMGLLEKAGLMRQRPRPRAPSVRRVDLTDRSRFSDAENEAADFLNSDSVP